nr:tetraspanin [Hymenolepis microstoma]
MRSSCTAICRFAIGIANVIFGVLFITLGIIGVLLRTNKNLLVAFTNTFADKFFSGVENANVKDIANFIVANDVHTSVTFIVVGFVVGIVCLIGFIAACCSCAKLLKTYAIILTIAVILQSISVGVVFGYPGLYLSVIERSLEKGLIQYNPNSEEGKSAAHVWDLVMETENEICCGMQGAADFKNSSFAPTCPKYCCKSESPCPCDDAIALQPPVPGCRGKVEKFSKVYRQKTLIIFICVIVAQAILAISTFLVLSYKAASPI